MSTAITDSLDILGKNLSSLFLKKDEEKYFSITEAESLKIEIARCDRQIEYYQDLKRYLENKLEILKKNGL